jgi:DNA-binding transcriptional regulator/RsmH inhibitor MraZ
MAAPVPIGWFSAKVDPTGRVKLPARFQEYLRALEDKVLFMTEFDGLGKIYTNGSWSRNVNKLSPDPDFRKRFKRLHESRGGELEMDPQGRVTLPLPLRQQMGWEDNQVWLRFDDDIISVYTEDQKRLEIESAQAVASTDMLRARALGFEY